MTVRAAAIRFSMKSRMGAGVLALVLLFVALWLGAAIGETSIPLDVVAKTVANRLWYAGYPLDPIDEGIVWSYRLSRAVVAGCCGAALALSGVVLQSLCAIRWPILIFWAFRRSFHGAVSVAILGIGAGILTLSFGAFIGAIVAFALVAMLAMRAGRGQQRDHSCGHCRVAAFNALTSFIVTKAANAEQARGIMLWLLGNLSGVRWPDVALALPARLAGLAVCLWHARALDAFTFGGGIRRFARHSGTPYLCRADRRKRHDDGGHGVHRRFHRLYWPRHTARRTHDRGRAP
ncbi:iron chelate uptake ABC transporter family permease subunit [Brucella abortus]|nr:iron chelate uptake ABC transporter family permease subunit [Brucella abortus]